jgi:hypothetical protein
MEFYSLTEAVQLLGISYHRVYYATVTGKIAAKKAGHSRLLTKENLEQLRTLFAERGQNGNAIR